MSLRSRNALSKHLKSYHTHFPEEKPFVSQFLNLLQSDRCYYRDFLPGHITGSALITNASKDKFLLVHHAKLNRWLQPGGHADGDEDITAVALREAREETGLTHFTLLTEGLFDIDIHPIPLRNNFPEHLHFDIRFLLEADEQEPLILSAESKALAWIKKEELNKVTGDNQSIQRMLEKTNALPRTKQY